MSHPDGTDGSVPAGPGQAPGPDVWTAARASGHAGSTPAAPSADAVRRDPEASYEAAAAAPPVDAEGRAVISAQLGRPARGNPAVVHRCVFGLPTVVRVDPRLDDGTPFPTTFWLSCPVMRSQIGRLEADHAMVGLNERLDTEADLAADYAAGHERYVAFRDDLGEPLTGDPGAGGMPRHIKCLHVHGAHHLATGDNPIGAWTIDAATPVGCKGPCVSDDEVDRYRPRD